LVANELPNEDRVSTRAIRSAAPDRYGRLLTLPFELRDLLAYDARTLGAVSRIFVDSVLGFYKRRLGVSASGGQGGAVTVAQRTSSGLRLNPHLHAVFLDGGVHRGR
jgi:hypothetical protein